MERPGRLDLGWVSEYASFVTELTESPYSFNELTGLAVVATAIQRRAWLPMSFGDIYPNLYGCIIADTSVWHKSASIARARLILNNALMENLILSELQTSEGLLSELRDKSAGIILRDEIGTLFDSHNTKYLRSLKPDITALYDCYPYSRKLSKEEIAVHKPYLNILGATTPDRFFSSTGVMDWRDGFLARWLFIVPDEEVTPSFNPVARLYSEENHAKIQKLALKLMELDQKKETAFTAEERALSMWGQWQADNLRAGYEFGNAAVAGLIARYNTYALKFAVALSAINGKWGCVTADTMHTAINLVNHYKANAYHLMEQGKERGLSGAKMQRVFKCIQDLHRTRGKATSTLIQQTTGYKADELEEVVSELLKVGAISSAKAGRRGKQYSCEVASLPVKVWK